MIFQAIVNKWVDSLSANETALLSLVAGVGVTSILVMLFIAMKKRK